jgi:hypothetical protein
VLLLFKRNDILGFAILVFVAFLLQLSYFVNPPELAELGNFYTNTFGTFNWLRDLYVSAPRFYLFLSTLFWLGVSIYFKQVIVNLRLVEHRDFVPSIALLLVVSSLPTFMIFSVASLAAVFIFVGLGIILGTPYNKTARSRYLIIGLFFGVAFILYWPFIWVFLAAIIVLLSMRLFVLQEIIALILGMMLPIYLVWTLHFVFTGHMFTLASLALPYSLPVSIQYRVATLVLTAFIIIFSFYGIYISRNTGLGNRVQHIKKWNGVLLFFIISLFAGLGSQIFPSNSFILPLISFSIILCSALLNNLKKYNTFTLYLVLIVVLSLQWVLRFI